ncbi:MAG: chemotaxis protein CheW [Planctomycetota bacterium]
MSDMDPVIQEFLVESHEGLDRLDRSLVDLEQTSDRETLAAIFRTIHSIKGACGCLGFAKLEKVSHHGESLLSMLRDGEREMDTAVTSALLAMVDAIREILTAIESAGDEGGGDYTELIAILDALRRGEVPAAPAAAAPPPQTPVPASAPDAVAKAPAPAASPSTAAPEAATTNDKPRASETIRVDVALLDSLMNLVGELVLARNQILQFGVNQQDSAFSATTQRLNLITTELQEGVMKTRMQPIDNVWSKFPRIVRDLARGCGKDVRLEMVGRETELDRTIIEAIKDPLTHVVRNSVDHGIEMPDARVAAGKPSHGTITLRAFHEGGQVNIEIGDDGKGLDGDRILNKARERGLLTADQAARLTPREITNLIFLPGFSTAEKVTNISGRGVGMDVVKTNIEKIGGTVDLATEAGRGTTLRIKIPLTLAIIPALVVTCRGHRFAIPQVSLLELVRLEGEQLRRGIESIGGTSLYRLRGALLPLVHLATQLRLGSTTESQEAVNIVVLQADGEQFGLIVDEISDTEEIVVKPLSKQLKGLASFAGATIMGDGRVALILDAVGIAPRAKAQRGADSLTAKSGDGSGQTDADRPQSMLITAIGPTREVAIPLTAVERLEEFPVAAVEQAGDAEVVQYRGAIMPLVRVAAALDAQEAGHCDPLQVIVHSRGDSTVGLVVDRILDIVHDRLVLERQTRRRGTLGSAVIQGRVRDLVDVEGIVRPHLADVSAREGGTP